MFTFRREKRLAVQARAMVANLMSDFRGAVERARKRLSSHFFVGTNDDCFRMRQRDTLLKYYLTIDPTVKTQLEV